METSVGDVWAATIGRSGGAARASAVELDRRYAEPHRTYHDAAHVRAVLAQVAVLADEVGLDDATRQAVVLAACAHDVVHDGRPDDETRSAAWAVSRLTAAGLAPASVERVRGLVLATVDHAPTGDLAAGVLCDADLAVLGGTTDAYAAYVRAVRAEYAHVTDEQWRTGRAEVMRALLALPQLFATLPGRDRWEAAARENIEAELAAL